MQPSSTRRQFLQAAAAVTLGFQGVSLLLESRVKAAVRRAAGFGPLTPDPKGLLDLPDGFSYTVISRRGDKMDDGFLVPGQPDGMAAFPGPDGKTILVRNHELEAKLTGRGPFGKKNELLERIPRERMYDFGRGKQPCIGGTSTLLIDNRTGEVERQFLSLAGTDYNCAGGPTPWNSWLTCEESVIRADKSFEKDHGFVFEVPAKLSDGPIEPRPLIEMGRFRHEAVAVEPRTSIVYQTEDREDGLIYRYIPKTREKLEDGGRLQALCVAGRPSLDTRNWPKNKDKPASPEQDLVREGEKLPVAWMDLERTDSPNDDLRHRSFKAGAARFARGEGMWYGVDAFYFACTNGGRRKLGQIWRYTPSPDEGGPGESQNPGMLELFAEPNDTTIVKNADNLTVAPWGDVVICEDSGEDNRLVGVTTQGEFYVLAQNRKDKSEFAGATFSPDGQTLFVNLQGTGLTLAIRGPWRS